MARVHRGIQNTTRSLRASVAGPGSWTRPAIQEQVKRFTPLRGPRKAEKSQGETPWSLGSGPSRPCLGIQTFHCRQVESACQPLLCEYRLREKRSESDVE